MKLKSVVVAALAAAFVFVGCDKNELTDPNKGDGTEQTDPNNPSDPSNPDGTDPEDPNNPGGENPGGENPGENPENPTLPGTEISLFDFAQLSNSDQTLYRISGHVWTVDVDDDQTLVILANCLYDEDNFDPTKHAVVGILNPTWLNNLNPALRPGHVLTVAGSKGTFGEEPDGEAIILNSQYVSHVDYSEPYLVFDMYVKPYLGSEAGEYTFNVYSNTDWTVTAPEGTTVTPASGNGCAELTFTYPANAKLEDMFYPLAFSYSGKTVELKFQQQALRYSLELSQYHVEVAADSTVASVDVLSNGAWTVTAPEGVTATPASGEGNATVVLTFAANETLEAVTRTVTFTAGELTKTFTLTQEAAAAPTEPEFEAGQYWIVESGFVGTPELKSGSYGYMIAEEAWTSSTGISSTAANAFTFEVAEGGYTIKDSKGRYLYAGKKNDGTYYNTFNASATATENHIWTVAKNADGTYKITNKASTFDIHFGASFKTFECVANVTDFPELVKAENAVPAVTLASSLTFEAEGGSQTITLPEGVTATPSCDNTAFTATSSANVVTVSAAATTEAQSGVLTLVLNYNGFAITKTVDLTQKAAPVAGETVVFEETFAKFNGVMGWSGSVANGNNTTADNENWTFVKVYGADGAAKFGTGSALGSAQTPQLNFNGTATLTFKAGAWNGSSENTTLKLSMTGGTLGVATVTLVKGDWKEYEVTITDATPGAQIKFEGQTAKNSRFFLDDVKIVKK